MKTPIYDSTKASYEQFEKEIDDFYAEIDRKVQEALDDINNWTEEKARQMKAYFERKAETIKKRFQKESENQNKKLEQAKEKVETIKAIIEAIKNPPSLDDIVKWAKNVCKYFEIQYEEPINRAADITKTVTYIATETPVVISKIARLPDALDKINSIPLPK